MLRTRYDITLAAVLLTLLEIVGCWHSRDGSDAFDRLRRAIELADGIVLQPMGYDDAVLASHEYEASLSKSDRQALLRAFIVAREPWQCEGQEAATTKVIVARLWTQDEQTASFELVGGEIARTSTDARYCVLLDSNELEVALLDIMGRRKGAKMLLREQPDRAGGSAGTEDRL